MENIYTVKLGNMEIKVSSTETQEYTESVAAEVNAKIKEITNADLSASTNKAALLAAMDFCDEVNKLREDTDNLRLQLKEYMDSFGGEEEMEMTQEKADEVVMSKSAKIAIERDEAKKLADKYKSELLAQKNKIF